MSHTVVKHGSVWKGSPKVLLCLTPFVARIWCAVMLKTALQMELGVATEIRACDVATAAGIGSAAATSL
jgi:hypothetical protein